MFGFNKTEKMANAVDAELKTARNALQSALTTLDGLDDVEKQLAKFSSMIAASDAGAATTFDMLKDNINRAQESARQQIRQAIDAINSADQITDKAQSF